MSKHIGQIYKNNKGLEFKVVEKLQNKPRFKIEFINSGYVTTVSDSNILKGSIKDKLSPSVNGIGIIGYADTTKNGKTIKEYEVWTSMLDRCYNEKSKEYIYYGAKGVVVSKRWLRFDYFLEDFNKVDGYNEEFFLKGELVLDKDKKQLNLPSHQKLYSLETCTLLSKTENSMLVNEIRKYSFIAISPNGDIVKARGISSFAKKYGLDSNSVCRCLSKKTQTHKGWKFYKIGESIPVSKNTKRSFIAISPEGQEIEAVGIKNFAREHGLIHQSISGCLNGRFKTHKGWTFKCAEADNSCTHS